MPNTELQHHRSPSIFTPLIIFEHKVLRMNHALDTDVLSNISSKPEKYSCSFSSKTSISTLSGCGGKNKFTGFTPYLQKDM